VTPIVLPTYPWVKSVFSCTAQLAHMEDRPVMARRVLSLQFQPKCNQPITQTIMPIFCFILLGLELSLPECRPIFGSFF
jgi:hypothetical protein